MKLFILALLLGVVYSSGNPLAYKDAVTYDWADIDHGIAFRRWMHEFGVEYDDDTMEEARRFLIFKSNWALINQHNMEAMDGKHTWTMGINQFSDKTEKEFIAEVGCLTARKQPPKLLTAVQPIMPEMEPVRGAGAPTAIDWTNIGGSTYVTPVKNQGNCGSCWAFSATGSLESFAAIATNTTGNAIIELSEQQLVDCTYGISRGCQGGLQEDAFDYIAKDHGLCTEKEYPYNARDGSCKATTCGQKYDDISGYKTVSKNSETSLVNAIAAGPIAVSVDAGGTGWQHYKSGVYSNTCGTRLDHGVLGVGYGHATSGGDYWKIKNSWGKTWGMQGYMLICRNCNKNGNKGECGILMDNTYPTLK